MNKVELMSLYWGVSWSVISELERKFGNALSGGVCLSRSAAQLFKVESEALFVTIEAPKICTMYLNEAGEPITNKTLTAEELKEAIRLGSVHPVRACNSTARELEVTVIHENANAIAEQLRVDVKTALEKYDWLLEILIGKKSIGMDEIESADEETLEAVITVVRTYASVTQAVDAFATTMPAQDKDKLLAILNANYVRSLNT